jgi:predicted phage terminase large subunit-like protein
MANLNLNGNVSKNEELLHLAYTDLITFGKMFSPQDFLATETPQFHRDVCKLLLDKKIQQLALILPRDHAKSTLAANAILHRFLFNDKDSEPEFICWVGEAQDQAIDNIAWIQNHIETNPAIHYYFGDLEGSKWTKSDIILSNGCRMIAKGASQRLRGKKQLSTRYTGIILDDFESELNTKTPDARFNMKNWVTAAVYPAIDFDKKGFLWCNGTVVHWDSFLNNILTSARSAKKNNETFAWEVFTKKAIEDGKPIWKSRWSMKKLDERKKFYVDSGTPAKFYQEYMNQARSPDDAIFSETHITESLYKGSLRWDEEKGSWYIKSDEENVYVNIYMGIDPASSVADRRDYSVIMVVGVSEEHDYYVIEYWRKRTLPMDCATQIFKIAKQYMPIRRINIETIAYQEMLRDYVMRESKRRGMFLPGIEQGIKGYTQKKKDRLFEGLQPLFSQGAAHLKKEHIDFIDELLDFPKGAHDDIIDAFWLAIQYTQGYQKPGGTFKDKKKEKKSYSKVYNWMTGMRKNSLHV